MWTGCLFFINMNMYLSSAPIHTKILYDLRIETSSENAQQSSTTFPYFWGTELSLGAAFLTDNTQATLFGYTVDQTWNK